VSRRPAGSSDFTKNTESMGGGRVMNARWNEFQTATLKPREAKVVQTQGTDNRLVFAEGRECVGV